jgi:polyisoprenoid-binding protein YceI
MRRSLKLLIGIPVVLIVLVVGGTWGYIHFIHGDAPEKLSLDSADASSGSTPTTAGSSQTTGSDSGSSSGSGDTWHVTDGSQAGYRVNEVLFGQKATAVGRTSKITGTFEVSGTAVKSGSFTVDMASVASNESRRDNQYRGRIMDVAQFPTSTFKLTQPIELASAVADGTKTTTKATGDLTLHGATKSVTIDLEVQRTGANVRVAGNIPVVFADWGIPNPSFGPAETEDHGVIEFLLVFAQ